MQLKKLIVNAIWVFLLTGLINNGQARGIDYRTHECIGDLFDRGVSSSVRQGLEILEATIEAEVVAIRENTDELFDRLVELEELIGRTSNESSLRRYLGEYKDIVRQIRDLHIGPLKELLKDTVKLGENLGYQKRDELNRIIRFLNEEIYRLNEIVQANGHFKTVIKMGKQGMISAMNFVAKIAFSSRYYSYVNEEPHDNQLNHPSISWTDVDDYIREAMNKFQKELVKPARRAYDLSIGIRYSPKMREEIERFQARMKLDMEATQKKLDRMDQYCSRSPRAASCTSWPRKRQSLVNKWKRRRARQAKQLKKMIREHNKYAKIEDRVRRKNDHSVDDDGDVFSQSYGDLFDLDNDDDSDDDTLIDIDDLIKGDSGSAIANWTQNYMNPFVSSGIFPGMLPGMLPYQQGMMNPWQMMFPQTFGGGFPGIVPQQQLMFQNQMQRGQIHPQYLGF